MNGWKYVSVNLGGILSLVIEQMFFSNFSITLSQGAGCKESPVKVNAIREYISSLTSKLQSTSDMLAVERGSNFV